MTKHRVGIFSGAFDPVHAGHVEFALQAAALAQLTKVYFLVEPRPRHKQGVKALEHRQQMVRLATLPHRQLGLIELEQQRFSVPHTWPQLRARFEGAEIYMLLGDDVFRRLVHWPQLAMLTREVRFLVGQRRQSAASIIAQIDYLERSFNLHVRYELIAPVAPATSSTAIRRALKQGQPTPALNADVHSYIRQQHLYASPETE